MCIRDSASTDPERMDTYHEGAARVIGEHLDELIIQSDDEYEGTRKGINLPILLDGEIAGVVGITGEREDVYKRQDTRRASGSGFCSF